MIATTRASSLRHFIRHLLSVSKGSTFSSGLDVPIINHNKTIIEKTKHRQKKLPKEELVFGKSFSDHMVSVDWTRDDQWSVPMISPYKYFEISPAACSLHYGIQCFEGMKAYKDSKGRIRLFRPDMNMKRLDYSMRRLAMPALDQEGFLECIKQLLTVDADWIPNEEGYSMYIRPTAIGTSPFLGVQPADHVKLYAIMSPVGPYFKNGFKPITLFADTENVRAWPGGAGNAKVGGNYGPAIAPSAAAASKHGCSQVL